MDSVADTAQIGKVRRKRTPGPYKGVRMRRWGRWVSEIRVPNSQMRIWLGSYDTPEKAARAYDAALFCLRGAKGSEQFNFPTEKRPEIPDESLADLSMKEIKEIAAKFAFLDCGSTSSRVSTSVTIATTLPDVLITNETAITTLADVPVMNKRANACKGGDSIVAGNAPFPPLSPLLLLPTLPDDETMLPEILLWEDPIMYDPGPLMGFNKYFADIM